MWFQFQCQRTLVGKRPKKKPIRYPPRRYKLIFFSVSLFPQTKKLKLWNRKTIYNPKQWKIMTMIRGRNCCFCRVHSCLYVSLYDTIFFPMPEPSASSSFFATIPSFFPPLSLSCFLSFQFSFLRDRGEFKYFNLLAAFSKWIFKLFSALVERFGARKTSLMGNGTT